MRNPIDGSFPEMGTTTGAVGIHSKLKSFGHGEFEMSVRCPRETSSGKMGVRAGCTDLDVKNSQKMLFITVGLGGNA